MLHLSILNDFHEFPGLRHCDISDFSGEQFYHEVLNKKFTESYLSNQKLYIDLDKTDGYASSFLDEAFGNLVYDFTLSEVKRLVEIKSDEEPHWKEMIEKQTYIQWENRRKEQHSPKKTRAHASWYRLINSKLELNDWANVQLA